MRGIEVLPTAATVLQAACAAPKPLNYIVNSCVAALLRPISGHRHTARLRVKAKPAQGWQRWAQHCSTRRIETQYHEVGCCSPLLQQPRSTWQQLWDPKLMEAAVD
jgi:hypothetical protein